MAERFLSLLFTFLLAGATVFGQNKIKVACIGDSVTYGYGLEDRENESYPSQLQTLLGASYEVRNFGHNGATLLKRGHRPYISLPEFSRVLDYKADLIVIHLGLNDTDPRNWPNFSAEFIPDYRVLIDTLRSSNPKAKIWICLLTPIMHGHKRFQSGARDWHFQEQKSIERVASYTGVGQIDLYTPLLCRPDLFADSLHPNKEGAGIIAQAVYQTITGDFGGLFLSPMYTDNMVLQRGRPIIIHGMADKGESVEVSFAGKRKCVTTAENGKWSVEFPSMPAGGPYSLNVKGKGRSFAFSNVWIGEVWLCAGQSNMAFKLSECLSATDDISKADRQKKLHLFNMKVNRITNDCIWPASALDSVNRLQYFELQGWRMSDASTSEDFSAVGYHFARTLADSLDCHIGIINCSVGGSTTESWVDPEILRFDFPDMFSDWANGEFGQPWARKRSLKNIRESDNPLQRHPYQPGYLFDAGIRLLDNWKIKGVLWYQGESNAHNVEIHEVLFRLMVKGFRRYWDPDLAIQVVQLSGISTRPSWPYFRDSQRRLVESMVNMGLTVCSDLGHSTDVHPRNKKPVGERSAMCVLHNVYGKENIIPSGPLYKGCAIEGERMRLFFDYAEGMSVTNGFEIAGRNGMYYPAETIVEGSSIIVYSDEIKAPCAVRYGWKPNPVDSDLRNSSGYPASTFRDEVDIL